MSSEIELGRDSRSQIGVGEHYQCNMLVRLLYPGGEGIPTS